MANFAVDYDGTFTAAPDIFLDFIRALQIAGHSVFIVTMRYPTETDGTKGDIDSRLKDLLVPIVCTSRTAKKAYCQSLGIKIHVWVDDHPEAVYSDAQSIWGQSSPEGKVVVPNHD